MKMTPSPQLDCSNYTSAKRVYLSDYSVQVRKTAQKNLTIWSIVSSVGTEQLKNTCHNGIHKIHSFDYAIIMSGKIDMLVGEDVSHVKEEDVVVRTVPITPG